MRGSEAGKLYNGIEKENAKLVNNIYSLLPTSAYDINKSAIADTGASGHYLQADTPHNISLCQKSPIRAKQPNVQMLQSNKGCRMAV